MSLRKLIYLFVLFLQFTSAKAQQSNVVKIRLGNPVTLGAKSNDEFAYQWYRDGQLIPNEKGSTLTTKVPGNYQVRAINKLDCASDISDPFLVMVEYADLEVIKKSESRAVGPDEVFEYSLIARNNGNATTTNIVVTDVLPSNLFFVSLNDERATYENGLIKWELPKLDDKQFETLIIKVKAKVDGMVTNRAEINGDPEMPDPNLVNNTSTDIKKIIGDIKIPNVITPNGDGKNDFFKVDGIELYPENTLAIFNRWGNEVFRSAGGYKNNWDGNGLSEGTYYYIIKMVGKDGKAKNITGWVTLLRDK